MDRKEFEAAVKRRHRATTRDMAPALNAALEASDLPMDLRRVQFSVNIAQNVLKDALAVVARLSIPFSYEWVVELAARVAVYAITLAPVADRQVLLELVLQAIPEKLGQYEADGVAAADTDWREG